MLALLSREEADLEHLYEKLTDKAASCIAKTICEKAQDNSSADIRG